MRPILVLAALLAAVSCSALGTSPDSASVRWTLDGVTCDTTYAVSFIFDGERLGTAVLTSGSSSAYFSVSTGSHSIGARGTKATDASIRTWAATSVSLEKNQKYSHLLTCT